MGTRIKVVKAPWLFRSTIGENVNGNIYRLSNGGIQQACNTKTIWSHVYVQSETNQARRYSEQIGSPEAESGKMGEMGEESQKEVKSKDLWKELLTVLFISRP